MNGTRFKAWWRTRTLREQRLLLAMASLAALVLAWLLIIRPLDDALSDAKQRYGAAVIALAETRAQTAALQAAESTGAAALPGPVDAVVSQAAIEAGFPITRLDRQGAGQATLAMEAVRPQAIFGWIDRMESNGLVVERLTATPNSDRTIAVQATFRARSD